LKIEKIATSRDDAEWVTRTHRLSDILDFQKKLKILTAGTRESHSDHCAKFCEVGHTVAGLQRYRNFSRF